MKTARVVPKTIDEYISGFPENVRLLLEQIRAAIRAAAPEAVEKISYQMPAFDLNGNLVFFAAWKKHIGFYPSGSRIAAFKTQLAAYPNSKGSIQFVLDQPIPLDLIGEIVQFRVAENLRKSKVNDNPTRD
jgi:uncharacterized protein YdhG (YjbR/CyaY superfamily)